VNETFARRYFGSGTAVGRRFHAFGRPFTVVGLVADSKYHQLSESAQPYFYIPLKQQFAANTGVGLHVRTAGDPLAMMPAVREAMRGVDPAVPADLTTTMADYTSAAFFTQQIAATLLSVLGGLALLLSSIGLYSLIAYGVARRRLELGVRVALGATASDIRRLVVGRGLALVACGVGAGLVLAVVSARSLGSLLFGVSPIDAWALSGASALLVAVASLASYIPARAAARVDPMAALRAD
jgi:predicted lysophospholipase L1 biosynthesis ABC-type transport system permease subunit